MITDGEKAGGDGYFVELGPSSAVGADRPRRLAPAVRHPRVALPQPGARLPRRHRPGLRRPGVQDGRDDGLQQRPRQLVEDRRSGKDKEYIEVAEGKLFDPKGAKGRYVRLYSNGNTTNDLNHYVEVEVYGLPK